MKTIIQWIGKFIPTSYRTKLGGIGLILLGALGGINAIFPDLVPGAPVMSLEECITAFSAGFVAIGIGNKIDRNTAAINGEL